MRVTEVLPFVPTTWIEAKRFCGMPSSEQSRRIRSSPSFQPRTSRRSRISSARPAISPGGRRGPSAPQLLELSPIGGELRALRVDHVGRRLGDKPLVGELPLPPPHLGPELLSPLLDSGANRVGVDAFGLEHLDTAHVSDRLSPVLRELDPGKARDQLVR